MNELTNKYKDIFLFEGKEHIDAMNSALLKLEKQPEHLEFINEIFRQVHTLKGMAATMSYNKIAQLCHAIENVLDGIRKNNIKILNCVDALFESFDMLSANLKGIKDNNEEVNTDAIIKKLDIISTNAVCGEQIHPSVVPLADKVIAEKIESVEIKVERLDRLMNISEELLINKMRLGSVDETLHNPELTAVTETFTRLISELQYVVMQARLVPIGFVFDRFSRMVRDLSKALEKDVKLEVDGGDIELDRGVIDEISEGLVHLVRNAIDHGIEKPEERKRNGKNPQGTIKLTAASTKDSAIIKIIDDGSGLDTEAIKTVALKQGIISPTASKEEILNSIFSGVSTAKQVTQISGRGFGVNIVKNKINSIKGTIAVDSERGKGTTFTMEVPLTLAIIKALFVQVGGKQYAIPLANVEKLVAVAAGDIKGMLNYEAVVINDEEIPITRLDSLFGEPQLKLAQQPIAIVMRGQQKLALAVDAFLSTQEIVIKQLNKLVRENRYFAGFTIVGSGEAVLILDISNLMLTKRGRE